LETIPFQVLRKQLSKGVVFFCYMLLVFIVNNREITEIQPFLKSKKRVST
jgi:hypothetical protein